MAARRWAGSAPGRLQRRVSRQRLSLSPLRPTPQGSRQPRRSTDPSLVYEKYAISQIVLVTRYSFTRERCFVPCFHPGAYDRHAQRVFRLPTPRHCDGQMPSPPCPHGRQRSQCKECGGSGLCEHGRRRSQCKECGGSGICEHGRQRSKCKECGGGGICEHGRERSRCKDCGGTSICKHGRERYYCKDCGGSRQDTILLEATAVEVDEDAEPDEWIPTVQSYIVVAAGPRGGKRKR